MNFKVLKSFNISSILKRSFIFFPRSSQLLPRQISFLKFNQSKLLFSTQKLIINQEEFAKNLKDHLEKFVQNKKVSHLEEIKRREKNVEQIQNINQKIEEYSKITELYIDLGNYIEAQNILKDQINNYLEKEDSNVDLLVKAKAYYIYGNIYFHLSDYDNAIAFLKKADIVDDLELKFKIYNQLGKSFSKIKIPESSILYLDRAHAISQQLKNIAFENDTCLQLAEQYSNIFEFEKANRYLDTCILLSNSKNPLEKWRLTNEKASNFMRMENYESAIETYLKNLAFLKTANSNYYELLTLDQLINCLEKNSNIEEAIKYSLQMFTVSQLGNNIKGQIQSLLYQAKLYWRLNQIQKSEEILNKASKLVSEGSSKDLKLFELSVQYQRALLLKNKEQIEEAKNILLKVLYEITSLGTKGLALEAKVCEELGDIFLELSNFDSAKTYFHRSLQLFEQLGDSFERIKVYSRLMKTYRLLAKHRDVAVYLDLALKLATKLKEKKILNGPKFDRLQEELKKI